MLFVFNFLCHFFYLVSYNLVYENIKLKLVRLWLVTGMWLNFGSPVKLKVWIKFIVEALQSDNLFSFMTLWQYCNTNLDIKFEIITCQSPYDDVLSSELLILYLDDVPFAAAVRQRCFIVKIWWQICCDIRQYGILTLWHSLPYSGSSRV